MNTTVCTDCGHGAEFHASVGCLVETQALDFCDCRRTRVNVIAQELPAGTYPGATGDTAEAVGDEGHVFGKRGDNQARALELLNTAQTSGLTWAELAAKTGWHHGVTSGVLSTLHRAGKIQRLLEKRDRRSVYVLNAYVAARVTVAHGRKRPTLTTEETDVVRRLRASLQTDATVIGVRPPMLRTLLDAVDRLA